jgi:tRNA(Ile)-lysidine synthase
MLAQFIAQLARLGFDLNTHRLGLAVSGGGDSVALMHLAHQAGVRARVATVDHRLRAASAEEAQMVARAAQDLGYDHDTLIWQGWDGRGNVQDRARRARRDLLSAWAQEKGLDAVALAHTQGDVAEGFVMRLARGAGVDGLAAMPIRFVHDSAAFLRPLLWATRDDLRDFCTAQGAVWVDDPSNEALKFDRVRARKALPQLAKLGIGPQVLADVAAHLREASNALDVATDDLARTCLQQANGIITLAPDWQNAPPELQRRLIQRMILWIAPTDYPPRGAALGEAMVRVAQGLPTQLAGCHFLPHLGKTLAFREARHCGVPTGVGALWGGIWRYVGQAADTESKIAPLGAAGLLHWQGWRALGLPRAALLSQPCLWADGEMIATPFLSENTQTHAFLRSPAADSLYSKRLSH